MEVFEIGKRVQDTGDPAAGSKDRGQFFPVKGGWIDRHAGKNQFPHSLQRGHSPQRVGLQRAFHLQAGFHREKCLVALRYRQLPEPFIGALCQCFAEWKEFIDQMFCGNMSSIAADGLELTQVESGKNSGRLNVARDL